MVAFYFTLKLLSMQSIIHSICSTSESRRWIKIIHFNYEILKNHIYYGLFNQNINSVELSSKISSESILFCSILPYFSVLFYSFGHLSEIFCLYLYFTLDYHTRRFNELQVSYSLIIDVLTMLNVGNN